MLHLICALKCEAQPIINYFQLKHIAAADAFPCYASKDGRITLTISGPGKINAAAATSYTHVFFNCSKNDAWLNIGIAGHRSLHIGQTALAHKVVDSGNGNVWFPQIVFTSPCITQMLITLDIPSFDYEDALYDMEAAGFYAVAGRLADNELVHVLKIISDNSTRPASRPDEKFVKNLIGQQLQTTEQLINTLLALSSDLESLYRTPEHFEVCIKRWHFTRYEQHSLLRVLRRWHILKPGENPIDFTSNASNSSEVITILENTLDSTPVSF